MIEGPVNWLSAENPRLDVRRDRSCRDLARDRHRSRHSRGGRAAHSEGIRRSGRDLRRERVDALQENHAAALEKPSLQTALILRTVLAFEVFAVVYAIGGRNFPVLVGEAYAWQNENQNYGVAAAYAILVMVISLAATVVYLKALRVNPETQP